MSDTKTQLEELAEAARDGRQPNCVACSQPLTVRQETGEYFYWVWDEESRRYTRSDDMGQSDTPTCEVCGNADWDYLDDGEPHTSLGLTW